ncbi:MAG: contractile injection system protein, VgrG/Pvc8 family [Litorilinea sp.]
MVELSVPTGIVTAEAAITVDGQAQPRLNAGLLALLVEETTVGLYRCEARFGNWGSEGDAMDYRFFDRSLLDFGKEFAVTLGSDEGEGEVFRGVISSIEGQYLAGQPPQIVVLAEDAAQDLRVTRRTRTFEDVGDAEAFAQIANEHDLQAGIDIDGSTQRVIAQLNQSDLAFIRERARRLAAEVWIEAGTLYVQSRSRRREQDDADLMLQFGRGLLEFSVAADTANQYTQVLVSGWDVQTKDTLAHEAGESTLANELNGDESGTSIVNGAFGARMDRIAQQVPLSSDEAQHLAEAVFRAQARRFVVGTGQARGDARIRVGRSIRLQGLGAMFTGTYYVIEVRHLFDRQPGGGYTTEFVVERAGIGRG